MSQNPPEADEAQRSHFNDGPFPTSDDQLVFPVPPPYHPRLPGVNPSDASGSTLVSSPSISFPTPINYPPLPQSPTSGSPSLRRHSTVPNIYEDQRQGDISVVSRSSRRKMSRVSHQHSTEYSSTANRPEVGGHIPQRGPRRRMTLKKVGYLFPFPPTFPFLTHLSVASSTVT